MEVLNKWFKDLEINVNMSVSYTLSAVMQVMDVHAVYQIILIFLLFLPEFA